MSERGGKGGGWESYMSFCQINISESMEQVIIT